MKVSVFGLGYVGSVSAGCLAKQGNAIIGVDISKNKIELINSGKAPIVEEGLEELIALGVKNKLIMATTDLSYAVSQSEVGIICVGTPNLPSGNLNMNQIHSVAKQIGTALKSKNDFYTITIRSTVMPGTNAAVSKIIEQESGKLAGKDFSVISNPEFLREGNAIDDFFEPPYTVIAGHSEKGIEVIRELFSFLATPILVVDVQIAELIKFLNNSYHAFKVAFGNEVGRLCKELNVDSYELMDLFVRDTDLNISPKYFKPGFSFGGSCLPKDLRAFNSIAHDQYINLPIFESIDKSNVVHNDFLFQMVQSKAKKKVGIVGLAFKAGTDDLRFSPSLELCEKLIGKGYEISIYDENINLSRLVGKNKDFLFTHLPHIDKLLSSNLEEFLSSNDLIVFAHNNKNVVKFKHLINNETNIIDIANISELKGMKNYEGICW
ncbi:UDP-glucose/GDP-mannose dehydrogenase family protein [Flavobacteriaceae bacterium PRS1]|nr:UDP-glucose/GDP-mannose dehydrogenase family protein [Flavobacteriaceae bacterium PRS1]